MRCIHQGTLQVPGGISFAELITRPGYDWVNDAISEGLFPVTCHQCTEVAYAIAAFDPALEAVSQVRAEIQTSGWWPSEAGHLFAYGCEGFVNEGSHPLIALGQTAKVAGVDQVLAIWHGIGWRNLVVHPVSGRWHPTYRALVVRPLH